PISAVMCIVVVIATCNATNLLDGLDGLCSGVTVIIAFGFLALAVWLALWSWPGHTDVDFLRIGLCLAVAGAVLGFLPYNIPPASIFMGDAGSMLLGFFVATMMTMFCQEGNARWFIAAWAVFALPTLDTGLAVVRRVLSGKSIFAGDRSHLYDQLVDRGMRVKQVVVLFYVLAAVAAVVGVTVAIQCRGRHAVALYATLLVIVAVVFYKLGMITPPSRQAKSTPDDQESQSD
ncbi:MAG: undecaprenyl/decaprenyl-phosphate alpha-N-acetylglucosaminyl 1-phosphate transferase, partial [Phycisphaerae bacterium]|nr:undecaprenyl/decaprenyl-phosphate alpha-N-acetylglucosaminyl 1-phosphate transferase [Phycisphaerae bacterium]